MPFNAIIIIIIIIIISFKLGLMIITTKTLTGMNHADLKSRSQDWKKQNKKKQNPLHLYLANFSTDFDEMWYAIGTL